VKTNLESERTLLLSIALQWRSGEWNERQVHEEAERIWAQGSPWPEVPEDDPRSVVLEVVQMLDILNSELVISDDIPAILAFLETESGNEAQGWSTWRMYLGGRRFQE
jgi:hypothetical protein